MSPGRASRRRPAASPDRSPERWRRRTARRFQQKGVRSSGLSIAGGSQSCSSLPPSSRAVTKTPKSARKPANGNKAVENHILTASMTLQRPSWVAAACTSPRTETSKRCTNVPQARWTRDGGACDHPAEGLVFRLVFSDLAGWLANIRRPLLEVTKHGDGDEFT